MYDHCLMRRLVFAVALVLVAVSLSGGEQAPLNPKSLTKEEARARLRVAFDLKWMALALGNFADSKFLSTTSLPPADGLKTKDFPKLEGLSWRTYVLATIDDPSSPTNPRSIFDGLYQGKYPPPEKAEKSEQWNRPELLKLSFSPFRPAVEGKAKNPADTFYRVFLGKGAAFEPGKLVSIDDFPDGRANTILVVEAAEAVPWPKPAELEFSPDKKLPKLGSLSPDGFFAVFADGKVRFLPKDIDEKQLRAMITRNGGEKIDQLPPEVDTAALGKIAEGR
jgi:hypothetical protein